MTASATANADQPPTCLRLRNLLGELPAVLRGSLAQVDRSGWVTSYIRFKKDPYYFLRYYLANIAVLVLLIGLTEVASGHLEALEYTPLWLAGLILFVLPSFSLIFLSAAYYVVLCLLVQSDAFTIEAAALVPIGVLAGTISAALMHNAAHSNFRFRVVNRFWGEVCGLFQLTGFAGWSVSHFIHHAAPDNPEKDAHAPGDMRFGEYVNAMGHMMKKTVSDKYFISFGENRHSKATWALVSALLPAVRYTRILFILALLGPVGFVFLYVPFKIANTMIYGDFNYRTHRPNGGGGYEVLNLDHNAWFKFLNAISIGSYYHKNHHRNPNVFNPRNIVDDGRPFITYGR